MKEKFLKIGLTVAVSLFSNLAMLITVPFKFSLHFYLFFFQANGKKGILTAMGFTSISQGF